MPFAATIKKDPRVTVENKAPVNRQGSAVIYWMHRSQRIDYNPSLNLAAEAANELRTPLIIFFALNPTYPMANLRHFQFMVQGLDEVADQAKQLGIPFVVKVGYPVRELLAVCRSYPPKLVVGDQNPLQTQRGWRQDAARGLKCQYVSVDSDVVIPSSLFPKEEYSAYTLRKKLIKFLPGFLQPPPPLPALRQQKKLDQAMWQDHCHKPSELLPPLTLDRSIAGVSSFYGGPGEAQRRMNHFIEQDLNVYNDSRNKPESDGTSRLSPYIHFGQLSVQQLAYEVHRAEAVAKEAKEAFLEQLIVRRELAINYVRFNENYTSLKGCPSWAQQTLREHEDDPRPVLLSKQQLKNAESLDQLWNAAQRQLLQEGYMHGYMRMYWAKKILEWTKSPEQAFEIALELNDTYLLDGRDPNGYTGIAWAIGGKHDRAWGPKRNVFGTIRYMSLASTGRKFDSAAYIARYQ